MSKTIIIAEAGVNHNGSLLKAKKLIDIASRSGADIVKFQTFRAENLVTKTIKKAKYQQQMTGKYESQYSMLKKIELKEAFHSKLIKYCKTKKIEFLSTAFDIEGLEFLKTFKLKRIKIPSGEITNYPYLKKIAQFKKETIISTGMSNLREVKNAINVLKQNGLDKNLIKVMHCTTEYPAPMNEINLNVIISMKKELGLEIGYSDHTLGIEAPIAAVAMGAKIIEKHITINKNLPGPDQKASLEEKELKQMILAIRNIENAMGDGIKNPSKSEIKNINIVRKFIVAKKVIVKGDIFSDINLTTKRCGGGISPMLWKNIIGKKSKNNFKKDQIIKIEK